MGLFDVGSHEAQRGRASASSSMEQPRKKVTGSEESRASQSISSPADPPLSSDPLPRTPASVCCGVFLGGCPVFMIANKLLSTGYFCEPWLFGEACSGSRHRCCLILPFCVANELGVDIGVFYSCLCQCRD